MACEGRRSCAGGSTHGLGGNRKAVSRCPRHSAACRLRARPVTSCPPVRRSSTSTREPSSAACPRPTGKNTSNRPAPACARRTNGTGGGRATRSPGVAKRLHVDLANLFRQRPRRIDHDRRCTRERRYAGARSVPAVAGGAPNPCAACAAPWREHVAVPRSGSPAAPYATTPMFTAGPSGAITPKAGARTDLRLAQNLR